jgi:hypothetical protein
MMQLCALVGKLRAAGPFSWVGICAMSGAGLSATPSKLGQNSTGVDTRRELEIARPTAILWEHCEHTCSSPTYRARVIF